MKLHARFALPMLLTLATTQASAATLGNLTTSVGLFAGLVALLVMKAWPHGWASAPAPGIGVVVLALVGAALLWRTRHRIVAAATALLPVAGLAVGPSTAQRPGSATPSLSVDLPPGLDRAALLATARRHFVELQAAWDEGNIATLRNLTTPELLEDLCCQLPERGQGPNRTDVLTLHAELLGFEQWGSTNLLSIEFSGMIRESSQRGAVPFRELWMLAQPHGGESSWRLARQQALL